MKNNLSKNKNLLRAIIAVCVFAAGILILYNVYKQFAPKSSTGEKNVTVKVTSTDSITSYQIHTDASTLHGVLDEIDDLSYEGEEGSYGLMITTVNGVEADYSKDGAYWAFYVNDEYCNYGIDEQPVNDGDVFDIVYTTD